MWDALLARILWRDDSDWIVIDRRRDRRDVLTCRFCRATQFKRDFPIKRPCEIGQGPQGYFGFAGQLTIDIRTTAFKPARELLLSQTSSPLFRDSSEEFSTNPSDEPAGRSGSFAYIKPKERHQAKLPLHIVSRQYPVRGAACGWRCDNPGRDYDP